MAKMTITEGQEFDSPPAGVYAAVCKGITPDTGQFGDSYKWVWELSEVLSTEDDDTAEDFIGEEIWGWSSQSASTKGKFVKWAAAHLGVVALDKGDSVDTDDFIGATVRLLLESTTKDDGTSGHKVGGVGVYKAKKTVSQPQREVEDDDEPERELAPAGSRRRRANEPF